MLRTIRILLAGLLVSSLVVSSASAQSLADSVVGFYTSSTGTAIRISYSGNDQKVGLRLGSAVSDIDCWLNGSRDGRVILSYTSGDGTKMVGTQIDANTISIKSESSSFTATWRRN